jgi:2-dehydropantoate 2-reductase
MWEKWVFLSTAAGSHCLMRAPVGDINAAPGGTEFVLDLLGECRSVAEANGYSPRSAALERSRAMLTAKGSPLTASMLRDIEKNAPIEADHIIGDILSRAKTKSPLLTIVYAHLKAYESRRAGLGPPNN